MLGKAVLALPARETREQIALSALFLGACAIAFAPIFVRASEVAPTATAFWRFTLAVPVVWLWFAMERGRRSQAPRRPAGLRDRSALALAGLFFAGDMGFWHWSIAHTSVANATLLANTAPVFVVLGAWLLFGERVRPLFLAGMALAFAGTALLMRLSASAGETHLLGDLLGVVTGAFYGAYLLAVSRLRAVFSTATIMAHAVPVSAIIMLAASLGFGESLAPVTLAGWGVLAGLALVSQVFGQGLIAFGLARLPASFASVSLLVQPLIASCLAWLLLGEAVGPIQALGAAAILAGITIARRASAAR